MKPIQNRVVTAVGVTGVASADPASDLVGPGCAGYAKQVPTGVCTPMLRAPASTARARSARRRLIWRAWVRNRYGPRLRVWWVIAMAVFLFRGQARRQRRPSQFRRASRALTQSFVALSGPSRPPWCTVCSSLRRKMIASRGASRGRRLRDG